MNKTAVGCTPLIDFDDNRAHEVMALMLDPRYCRGQTFQSVHEDNTAAKALWKKYTSEALIPTAVTLAANKPTVEKPTPDNDDNARANTGTGICDSDSDDDSDMGTAELIRKVELELRLFRKAKDLPEFADKKVSPLGWWAKHATTYPTLADLARIVLAIPGSQIECERVFSLAGLLTARLRNRMSPENLGNLVFLSKNLDVDVALNDLLTPVYGEKHWEYVKDTIGKQSESMSNEKELYSSPEGDLNWYVMESLLEEFEPLIEE